jgi:Phage integrase family
MADDVARAIARVLQRDRFTGPDDYVFIGADGRYLDSSALRRRYRAARRQAGLNPIRFHDLRHTFGSLAINQAESVRELQDGWVTPTLGLPPGTSTTSRGGARRVVSARPSESTPPRRSCRGGWTHSSEAAAGRGGVNGAQSPPPVGMAAIEPASAAAPAA